MSFFAYLWNELTRFKPEKHGSIQMNNDLHNYINNETMKVSKTFIYCFLAFRTIEMLLGFFTFIQVFWCFIVMGLSQYLLSQRKFALVKVFCFIFALLPVACLRTEPYRNLIIVAAPACVTFTVLVLMTTRSVKMTIATYVVHASSIILKLKPWLVQDFYRGSLSIEKSNETVNLLIMYCLDAGMIILLGMLTQFHTNHSVIKEMFMEREKLTEINKKYMALNSELNVALKGKDDFLLSVSHELRNPLNILLGNVELATMNCTDAAFTSVLTHLKNAQTSGELLSFLINNLLDAGKLRSKQLEVIPTPTNMNHFIEKMWTTIKMLISRKNLAGQLYVSKDLPVNLKIDAMRLMQIMFNLVGNATKFTNSGGITIILSWIRKSNWDDSILNENTLDNFNTGTHSFPSLKSKKRINEEILVSLNDPEKLESNESISPYSCYSQPSKFKFMSYLSLQDDFYRLDLSTSTPRGSPRHSKRIASSRLLSDVLPGYLRIEVKDTGCGMSTTDIPKLFNQFSQVSDNAEYQQIGTGLGLWITQNLCLSMEGNIKAYSKVSEGSTFIAAVRCETSKNPVIDFELSSATKPSLKERVMVISNATTYQQSYKFNLQQSNVEAIDFAINIEDALESYKAAGKNKFYTLMIIDSTKPADWHSLCNKISTHEKANQWSPVTLAVLYDGVMETEVDGKYQTSSRQPDYFFKKPFTLQICRELMRLTRAKQQTIPTIIHPNSLVLVVDDDKFNTQIISEFLKKLNINSVSCANGIEALEVYSQNYKKISLVIMDCEMPIMNGYTTTTKMNMLCKEYKCSKSVKIVGLTGNASEETRKKGMEAGMSSVVFKPITFAKLQTIVHDRLQ
jgi:signal transduction histidine kinase/CheY-like chemotaxis protein